MMPTSWKKQLEVWHAVLVVAVTLVSIIASGAMAYARAQDDHASLKSLEGKVEATSKQRDAQINRIERNLVRIADRVGANVEPPKD